MKLPVFRNLQRQCSIEEMENALNFLEIYAESPAVKDDEREVIGEMISNVCGAMEMKAMVDAGMSERDAANDFMKRVLGSIDQ
ncbi:MAG TPA: hypothetical protein VL022_01605 [Moheibacter sp.]|nr:hypothetical protein [Moheibacter sp.]